nr:TetR/AcrR family transcriptional regulator [Propionibacterium australiense]
MVALAKDKSVARLTVAEVCRRAGISRDSFYRFAASPAELLAAYLYEDHNVSEVTPRHAATTEAAPSLTAAMRLVVEHVQRNLAIYTNALDPHFTPQLQDALLRRFTEVLQAHVNEFPEKLPRIDDAEPGVAARDALIAYVAFATLGAIESLVRSGAITDTELSVAILNSAIAPSWLSQPREDSTRVLPSP